MADRRKGRSELTTPDSIEDRLRGLESEIESILEHVSPGASPADLDPVRRQRLDQVLASFADRMQTRLQSIEPPQDEQMVASALQLLSPDHLLRVYGRFRMRHRSEEVDPFGADPRVEQQVRPLLDFLYDRYFRVDVEGVNNVPERGRCLLVSNRSGLLPWDALMIKAAMEREHPRRRRVRWLIEDFVYNQPFMGGLVSQLGGVRACQEHAERLLFREELVCVFPEGVLGASKLYQDRYRLGRFGRGGYIKLVLRTGTPIVPVAVIGAEEAHPVIGRVRVGVKLLGMSFVPITPTFPALGPMGLVPIPTKWKVVFGEPLVFDQQADAVDDLVLVRRLNERVRTTIQAMITESLRGRRSVLFG
jgi:1-acyl-sn-glycerol-3-phosphate acyltransferase